MSDTRTAFQAWHARAMELSDAIASAQVNDDRDHGLVAARAALSEHLSELPMGEAVGFVDPGSLAWLASPLRGDSAYVTLGMFKTSAVDHSAPLYRHPKDTA